MKQKGKNEMKECNVCGSSRLRKEGLREEHRGIDVRATTGCK
jgi:hypothetical protein